MASNIDPTKPVDGSPTTQSVRQNFIYAKQEIEALQAGGGSSPQIANTVLAGPTSGGAALPSYRLLVSSDLPAALNDQITSINSAHTSLVSQVATVSARVSSDYVLFYDAINSIDGRIDDVSAAVSNNVASIVSVNTVVSALDTRVANVSATLAQASASAYTINQLTVVSAASLASATATHLVVNGTVCATSYYGDGSNLTNLPTAPVSVSSYAVNDLSVVNVANIVGKLNATSATFLAIVSAAEFDAPSGSFSTLVSTAALNVSGAISGSSGVFSGTVSVNEIDAATGSFSTKVSAAALVVSGVVSGASAVFSGNVSAAAYYGDGANLTNLPAASTSVVAYTVNQLTVVSGASFLGKVSGTASEFSGIVSALEVDAPTGSFSTLVSAAALTVSGVVSGNSAVFSGAVSALEFDAPTGSFSTKVSAAALVVSGVVSGASAVFSADVCAATFYGSGAGLTNLPPAATSVATFTVNQLTVVSGAAFTGKVSGTAAEFSGVVSALELDAPTGSFSTLVSAAALTVSGVVSGNSAVFSGVVSALEFDAPTGSFSTLVSAAALNVTGAVSGTSGVFTGVVSALEFDAPTGSFSTLVSAAALNVTGAVSGTSGVFTGVVSALEFDAPTGSFSTKVSAAALVVTGVVSGSSGVFSGTVSVNEVDASIGSFSGYVSIAGNLNVIGNLLVGTAFAVGKAAIQGGQAGTATASTAFITLGQAQGERADLSLYSTFQGTADNGPRRTADIIAGFNNGNWGTEYLAFNVGNNGSVNDSNLVTSEKMRINSSGVVSASEFASPTGSFSTKVSSSALVVSGVVSGSTATFSGAVCATSFFGSGAGLTGLSAGLTLLVSAAASAGSSSIDFVSLLTTTYDEYWLLCQDVSPSNDYTTIRLQYSTDNGSTWKTTGYGGSYVAMVSAGGFTGEKATTGITVMYSMGATLSGDSSANVQISNVNSTNTYKNTRVQSAVYDPDSGTTPGICAGIWAGATSAVNAIRLVPSAGTIDNGTFRLYGVTK